MARLPPTSEYAVFLDTTELYSSTAYVTIPRPVDSSLASIRYYISRLIVEERAIQLCEHFAKTITPGFQQYSRLITKTCVHPTLDHFRQQITADLSEHSDVTIFDLLAHGAVEQALLFEARHHGSYKDAIIFGSAIAYAKENCLPRCIFVTQDSRQNGFIDLGKALSSYYPMKIMTRVAFKDMLQFSVVLYDAIISRLRPKFEEQIKLLRRELVKRGQHQPEILDAIPEALEIFALLTTTCDLSPICYEVRHIAVRAMDPLGTTPADVACTVLVRYSIPGKWGRLYQGNAFASLVYNAKGELADVHVADFDFDWMPCG